MEESIIISGRISEKDLYRFNIYHAYTSSQGIFSIIVAVLFMATAIMRWSDLSDLYKVMYPLVAILFLLYIPMSLRLKAKNQILQPVFAEALTYKFTDEGLVVSSPTAEDEATLPWEYIYKVVAVNNCIYIFSNRVNAYIIPKEFFGDKYDVAIDFMKSHVDDYKLSIKAAK